MSTATGSLAGALALFACPECRAPLDHGIDVPRLPFETRAPAIGITCSGCARRFAFADGVFILWSDDLRKVYEATWSEDDAALRAKHANVRVYEQISDDYEHTGGIGLGYFDCLRLLLAFAIERRGNRPSIRVDVGCAAGESLHLLSNAFDQVVGVDSSWENVRAAADLGYLAVLGDAESLPIAPKSASLITCTAALHHIPDPVAFMRSARAGLLDGGVLLTAFDPSTSEVALRGPGRWVWRLRLPVYRMIGRRRRRGYTHANEDIQRLNLAAEVHRDKGFDPEWFKEALLGAGFAEAKLFRGIDVSGDHRYSMPPFKVLILKVLSGKNPFLQTENSSLGSLSTA